MLEDLLALTKRKAISKGGRILRTSMTITDDYAVFAGHYHSSSDAVVRTSRIEVRAERVWCGEHIRFPISSAHRSPHGKPTSRGVSGSWQLGSFRASSVDDVVSKCGRWDHVVEAHEARKTVHEYCPTAVKTEGASGRKRNNMWQCRCR